MSVRDNVHFPNDIDLERFIKDFSDKNHKANNLQKKYRISSREYRLLVRYCREISGKPRYYRSPQRKYIYKNEYGIYVIRKRIGGEFKYFGAYRKLDEAIEIRDKLIENSRVMEL